jgi:hypothetical protein
MRYGDAAELRSFAGAQNAQQRERLWEAACKYFSVVAHGDDNCQNADFGEGRVANSI